MPEAGIHLRTLADLKECALLPSSAKPSKRLGCINSPLLDIELDHIVVDELHLLLRISDRLIDNLVVRAAELDHLNQTHCTGEPQHIAKLQQAVCSCGVHFKVC